MGMHVHNGGKPQGENIFKTYTFYYFMLYISCKELAFFSSCPSPWVSGLCGGWIDRIRERADAVTGKRYWNNIGSRPGLEPVTFRTTYCVELHELVHMLCITMDILNMLLWKYTNDKMTKFWFKNNFLKRSVD